MMDPPELEPISISAFQHWSYCPRQCALIHQEQVFEDNIHTQRGQAVHARVDTPGFETRAGCRLERALPLWSERFGWIGKADLVEFFPDGSPYPVEYKHGPRRVAEHDDLQLAAQALCLEEMTGKPVPEGAIFHASSKRRRIVEIGPALREKVILTAQEVRAMLARGSLPHPVADKRCRACSLIDVCQPTALTRYDVQARLRAHLFDPEE